MCVEDNDHTRALRDQLADELVSAKCIRSSSVENAFRKVPRHLFLEDTDIAEAYTNSPIVTKYEGTRPVSSSSQPSLMADMLEALDVRKGMRVLEIGAGTGYNAALIAELTQNPQNVYSIDIQEDIVDQCRANLLKAGYSDVHVLLGDGGYGHPPAAPYDRIIVACQPWDVPPAWIDQLKEGGVSVMPLSIEPVYPSMMIPKFVKREGCLVSEGTVGGSFMWMQGDFRRLGGGYRIVVIDPADHTGHLPSQETSFYIGCKDVDPNAKASIQCVFDSWKRKGNIDFASWQEERGFLLLMVLEGVCNLRAWSKSSEHGFEGKGVGILDIDAGSVALVTGEKGDIVVYGNDAAMEMLSNLISRWEVMRRPGVMDFQIRIHPLNHCIALKSGEWLVQKPSVQIVLSLASR